jgi:hypothetical protein
LTCKGGLAEGYIDIDMYLGALARPWSTTLATWKSDAS